MRDNHNILNTPLFVFLCSPAVLERHLMLIEHLKQGQMHIF